VEDELDTLQDLHKSGMDAFQPSSHCKSWQCWHRQRQYIVVAQRGFCCIRARVRLAPGLGWHSGFCGRSIQHSRWAYRIDGTFVVGFQWMLLGDGHELFLVQQLGVFRWNEGIRFRREYSSWCQHKFVQNDHQLLNPKNYSVLKKPPFKHFLAKIFQTIFSPKSLFRDFCSKIEFLPKEHPVYANFKKRLTA